MPDYNNSKIYTIRCRTDDTLIYVGHTTQPLSVRWGEHKRVSKRTDKEHYIIYKTINNEWDNWYIELYELYPCNTKEELCKKEGEIIRLIGNLNMKITGRTNKEWREDNKEHISTYNKKLYEVNKEKRAEQQKEWYEANKEKLSLKAKERYKARK